MILFLSLALAFVTLVAIFLGVALWEAKEHARDLCAERNAALNSRDIWCLTTTRIMERGRVPEAVPEPGDPFASQVPA